MIKSLQAVDCVGGSVSDWAGASRSPWEEGLKEDSSKFVYQKECDGSASNTNNEQGKEWHYILSARAISFIFLQGISLAKAWKLTLLGN